MPNLSNQMINMFYEKYSERDVAFNHSVIKETGLEPKNVYLKVKGEQWSCIVYSCSMKSAKIIVNMNPEAFDTLNNAKKFVNLRLSFLPPDAKRSLPFFIPCHVEGYKNFNAANKETHLLSLIFTKKPSNDLIEILGNIIHEKETFNKRKDIRISLEDKIADDLGLMTNQSVVVIDKIKRPCILRNLSASGAMIILSCLPKLIMNKKVVLYILFKSMKNPIAIKGTISRDEHIEGREDIYGIGITYDQDSIPVEYRRIISSYLDKLEGIAKQNQ